jgi:KR domain
LAEKTSVFLAQRGVTHLVLVGQSISQAAQTKIEKLEASNVNVTAIVADV